MFPTTANHFDCQQFPDTTAVSQYLIQSLDKSLEDFIYQQVLPSKFDKWTTSSALQKAIRRGDGNLALRATQTLLNVDPQYFFRRLPIIAFEELGIANHYLCALTLHASSKRFRESYGEMRLAYYLVGQISESIKSRTATDICCLTLSDPDAASYLHSCLNTPVTRLVTIALDSSLTLTHRMTALKVISGFSVRKPNGFHHVISKARLDLLQLVCEEMNAPISLTYAVILGNGKTECLNAALLLANEMLMRSETARVIPTEITSHESNGVNLACLDIYCKSGRAVISQFVTVSKALQNYFTEYPVKNPAKLIGTILFIIEGSLLDRELDFEGRSKLRRHIEYLEMAHAGIKSKAEAMALIKVLQEEMPLLERIRLSCLDTFQDRISNTDKFVWKPTDLAFRPISTKIKRDV